jgi:putative Holliday junction resolvase
MRHMGLDVGDRRIGVAVSDPLGITAQGVDVIKYKAWEEAYERLFEIIAAYDIGIIVVGLPKNMDGSKGKQAEKVEFFAELLREKCGLPIVFWDERLSTVAAEKTLVAADVSSNKRRQVIDKMAAVLILQGYLNRHRTGNC